MIPSFVKIFLTIWKIVGLGRGAVCRRTLAKSSGWVAMHATMPPIPPYHQGYLMGAAGGAVLGEGIRGFGEGILF